MEILKQLEKAANNLKLKYFRMWSLKYIKFLVENKLKHNNDLMIAYYNKVILLK